MSVLAPEMLAIIQFVSCIRKRALGQNDWLGALEHASQAIALDATEKSPSSQALSSHFMQRADIFTLQGQSIAAIEDVSSAVSLGGNEYLPAKIKLLVQAGRITDASDELNHGLSTSNYERERSMLRLLLAKLYLDSKEYAKAIDATTGCIQNEEDKQYALDDRQPPYMFSYLRIERMSAPAHVIKAKAEAELGR